LALFYEEYAALLESMGRKSQAAEIYQSGIENNARPADRLQRKFEEFQQRLEANPPAADEPHSPALPVVRPALAAKPFGGAASGGLSTESSPQQQQPQSGAAKSKKPKMAIFSDAENAGSSKPTEKESQGWENIGTLDHRKKENAQEPKPWAGETLKTQGKKASGGEKLMVFRDTSVSPLHILIYFLFSSTG
jgi:checkpoint serine/threonine-protein kinase